MVDIPFLPSMYLSYHFVISEAIRQGFFEEVVVTLGFEGWEGFPQAVVVQLPDCVLTLHDPMDCSTPGRSVPHHLLECAQVHIH